MMMKTMTLVKMTDQFAGHEKNRTMLDAKFVQPAVDPELLCIEQ